MDLAQEKWAATYWAYRLVTSGAYVILDTETTDLPQNGGEVIQLGMVDAQGNVLLDTLIKPKGKISAEAAAVHHITEEIVQEAPTFDELYATLAYLTHGKIIVAYNAAFDHAILDNTCRLYKLTPLSNDWACAMLEYARFYGEWNAYRNSFRWKKLTEAAKHLNLSTEGAHDALSDVRMTHQVILKLAEAYLPILM
jgi:DNA polymerase III subunit epsilon